MARKNANDAEKIRTQLLEIGLNLFEKNGYNSTGIQEIATAAEIPKGSFYNYFRSKEVFLTEVIKYYTENNIEFWGKLFNEAEEKCGDKSLSAIFMFLTAYYQCSDVEKGCLLGNLSAEISYSSEDGRNMLKESISVFKSFLVKRLLQEQESNRIRKDIPATSLADFIWDCWQGSLLRSKVEKSTEPVSETLELLFNKLLLPME